MNPDERAILKNLLKRGGLLSPADYLNVVANHDERSAHSLVAKGYVEEVSTQIHTGATHNFYRASEKGLRAFDPYYKKIFSHVKGDLRVIIVSAITTVITLFITHLFVAYFNF